MTPLLKPTQRGLFCEPGDFHVDPWQPVERAVITHAHSDHATPGSRRYLAAAPGAALLQARLGADATIDAVGYGNVIDCNGVRVSLHPAGHVLGSAQVRIEHRGEVCVVSGDYKRDDDPTCAPFEPLACHTFITESTFGLPVYRWPAPPDVFEEINDWWRLNQQRERASILFAYALGKAQRVLAGIDASIGPIFAHGAIARVVQVYELAGVRLPPVSRVTDDVSRAEFKRALILAPPSARASPWLRRFGRASTAFVSGWMRIRGARRQRKIDRGFVLSDHVDWPALIQTIRDSGARDIGVTHGHVDATVAWLDENGWNASIWPTRYEGELDEVNGSGADPSDSTARDSALGIRAPNRPTPNP